MMREAKPTIQSALTMCCCYSDSSSFLFWRLHMRMLIMEALTGGERLIALKCISDHVGGYSMQPLSPCQSGQRQPVLIDPSLRAPAHTYLDMSTQDSRRVMR